jgi:hypothetical protein
LCKQQNQRAGLAVYLKPFDPITPQAGQETGAPKIPITLHAPLAFWGLFLPAVDFYPAPFFNPERGTVNSRKQDSGGKD